MTWGLDVNIRKIARRSGYVVLVLVAIVAIGYAAIYFKHEPIPDLSAASVQAAERTVAGTARSMGIDVEG